MQRLPGPPREKGNTQYFVGQVIRHRKYGWSWSMRHIAISFVHRADSTSSV